MERLGHRLIGAAVGLLVGSAAVILLFFAIMFAMEVFDVGRVRARVPIVLIFLPFIAGLYGFRNGPALFFIVQSYLGDAGPLTRLVLLGPVFWAGVVLAFVVVFKPFGYRMYGEDWLFTLKIILFPTGVLWGGVWFVKKYVTRLRP